MSYAVEMNNITKRFPGVLANDQVNLTVKKGKILALIGENGAGKSTLMNILYGLVEPDEGEIKINGKVARISSPDVAISLGIGMVHQQFKLIESFSIADNICLGMEPTKNRYFIDRGQITEDAKELSELYGLKVDPRSRIRDCSVGIQQRVEILKALYRKAEILILDEPTAILTPQETEQLFDVLKKLVGNGKSIIFITHKLREVMEISDTIAVMRRGKCVGSLPTSDTTTDEVAAMMVGKKMSFKVDRTPNLSKEKPILRVEDLVVANNRGLVAVNGASFDVRPGEILAIAGIQGNGQSEMIDAIIGLRAVESGRLVFKEEEIQSFSPKRRRLIGIGHISEDRATKGANVAATIEENLIATSFDRKGFAKFGIFRPQVIREYAEGAISRFDVRTPSRNALAKTLSGGNLQKVIVAREISEEPELLIASQPTRGLDIGSIKFIHQTIIDFRNRGKGVLLVSTELDEIRALGDRIAVMYDGKIVAIIPNETITEEEIGLLMVGIVPESIKIEMTGELD